MRFLPLLLRKAVRKGRLTVIGPAGEVETFGGMEPGPEATIRIHDPAFDWKIAFNPELKAAEAYMDGALTVEDGDIHAVLEVFFANKRSFDISAGQAFWRTVARRAKRLHQHNPVSRSRANVKHHYELGDDLFRLFLDRDAQYSCAYFPTGQETLEEAQTAKKRHIAAKLHLADGQSVLDIGCGWGGLALYMARVAEVEVLGITLSDDQARVATARAKAMGVSDRVRFEVRDYREIGERFDRIVSVGMLEHVGAHHLAGYFRTVRDRLAPNGVALIHSISSKSPPGVTGPFIRKYIFPGGYSPSLSEISAAVEQSGLWVLDVEIWRKHYGLTLKEWRLRFQAHRAEAVDLYDERFARMWEFYLSACECVFLYGSGNVVQIQIGRERDGVPLSRDYILATTEAYRRLEREWPEPALGLGLPDGGEGRREPRRDGGAEAL
ncbi:MULTISPECIES: SAM-dependent methyltransferase [unclassified Aureimonas]|uniref:SAM-dependent methyltransferase n=1 Tax=unclassified Aureimonas TaxID=2615206 RepID=UPI0009E75AC9|nr:MULTISPECIES: cyclopropane-fatty-acyl-phospholipid synthase family protein [unclassified Aureimonas]